MKSKHRYMMLAALAVLVSSSCSGDSTETEYAVPHDMCEEFMGTAIPEEYFPPGERLHHSGMEAPASPACRAYVDGESFVRFQGTLRDSTLEEDFERIFNVNEDFPRTGDPESATYKDFDIEAWPEVAVATRTCTSPYLDKPERDFRLFIGVHFPEDFDNPRETLAEFIGPAAERLFDRVPMCEESPGYDPKTE